VDVSTKGFSGEPTRGTALQIEHALAVRKEAKNNLSTIIRKIFILTS